MSTHAEPLEVRRCDHCLAPLPVGRVIRGRCSACYAYTNRTGNPRPADRERSLEAVAIIANDMLKGMADATDLKEALENLSTITERMMHERHMTKLRSARASGIPHNVRWIIR